MAIRYDRAPLKATRTPEGFVQDSPILSRVGVFPYRQPDGTVRHEFRPPEEVFHADHLASIHGKPITDEHHGRITGDNARGKVIGSVLTPGRQDGDNLRGDIIIHDAAATGAKKELSLGYTLDLDETPGEYNGIRYDAVQRNMRVNHLALVKTGRAGNARLNLDAADAVIDSPEEDLPIMPTIKVRLDSAPGIEYEASPEVALALAAGQAALATEKARADGLQAKFDDADAKVKKHDAELAKLREDARAEVAARLQLENDAKELGAKFAEDAKDADIRVAVIKAVHGDSVDLTGKSDAYVEARYDMALADGKKAKANVGTARATMGTAPVPAKRADGTDAPATAQQARAAMIARFDTTTSEK
jgi:uncharacterized protein